MKTAFVSASITLLAAASLAKAESLDYTNAYPAYRAAPHLILSDVSQTGFYLEESDGECLEYCLGINAIADAYKAQRLKAVVTIPQGCAALAEVNVPCDPAGNPTEMWEAFDSTDPTVIGQLALN